MTTPPDQPVDPWQSPPGMSPEQAPPPGYAPPPPGWGGPPQYGAPPPYAYAGYQRAPANGMGIAALVLGIVGIPLAFGVVGGVLGALAVVFGIVGVGRVRRNEATNRGAAIGGVVTGGIAVLIAAGMLVVYVVFGDELAAYSECVDRARTPAETAACEETYG